jgi:hypothetical protein
MEEQTTSQILPFCTRSAITISTGKMPFNVVEGLSCLRGNYHEQFLGERDAATCALLPDEEAVGNVLV